MDVLDSDAPSTTVFNFAVDGNRDDCGSTSPKSNDCVHQHPLVMLNAYLDGANKNRDDSEDVDGRGTQHDCTLYHSNGMTPTSDTISSKKTSEKTMVHTLPSYFDKVDLALEERTRLSVGMRDVMFETW